MLISEGRRLAVATKETLRKCWRKDMVLGHLVLRVLCIEAIRNVGVDGQGSQHSKQRCQKSLMEEEAETQDPSLLKCCHMPSARDRDLALRTSTLRQKKKTLHLIHLLLLLITEILPTLHTS